MGSVLEAGKEKAGNGIQRMVENGRILKNTKVVEGFDPVPIHHACPFKEKATVGLVLNTNCKNKSFPILSHQSGRHKYHK